MSEKIISDAPENVRAALVEVTSVISASPSFPEYIIENIAKSLPEQKDREDLMDRLQYLIRVQSKESGFTSALKTVTGLGGADSLDTANNLLNAYSALKVKFDTEGKEKAA